MTRQFAYATFLSDNRGDRDAKLQLKLVDDILDHARLAGGKMRIELESIDARTALETVLEGIDPTAQAKGVAIDCEFLPGDTHISGDSVSAESGGEGQGATFRVRLPAEACVQKAGGRDAQARHGNP
jgi:hypothetical protein